MTIVQKKKSSFTYTFFICISPTNNENRINWTLVLRKRKEELLNASGRLFKRLLTFYIVVFFYIDLEHNKNISILHNDGFFQ